LSNTHLLLVREFVMFLDALSGMRLAEGKGVVTAKNDAIL
jgi:hypothetical protein